MKFPWRRPKRVHHSAHLEAVLGTSLELQIVSSHLGQSIRGEAVALTEIDRLEAIFNAYNPLSELRRWQETSGEDIAVSPELARVLTDAENWRKTTQGAFNPAAESLTRLWGGCAKENRLPTADELTPLLAQLNEPLWDVGEQRLTAARLTALPVTLNAIAKGFIIDRACAAVASLEGVQEVLVNIGGDIRHAGTKATTIAIADPHNDAENSAPADRIKIWNQGLATSGNYRRGFSIGEQWYSHVLDPRNGWPVEFLVGVSVLAQDAATADVLATAFNVLEPQDSLALADSLGGVGVLLLGADGARFSNEFWEQHRA